MRGLFRRAAALAAFAAAGLAGSGPQGLAQPDLRGLWTGHRQSFMTVHNAGPANLLITRQMGHHIAGDLEVGNTMVHLTGNIAEHGRIHLESTGGGLRVEIRGRLFSADAYLNEMGFMTYEIVQNGGQPMRDRGILFLEHCYGNLDYATFPSSIVSGQWMGSLFSEVHHDTSTINWTILQQGSFIRGMADISGPRWVCPDVPVRGTAGVDRFSAILHADDGSYHVYASNGMGEPSGRYWSFFVNYPDYSNMLDSFVAWRMGGDPTLGGMLNNVDFGTFEIMHP